MKKMLFALLVSVFLSSCAIPTQKELVATGGSKADGVIELSYEYTQNEDPIVDKAKGLKVAEARCKAWGYSKVEEFGGVKRVCNQGGGWNGCFRYYVSVQYQCLD